MRAILISTMIIFFCLGVQMVYLLDDAVYAEQCGKGACENFLKWRTPTPPITRDNIPGVQSGVDGLNGTIGVLNPMQQQSTVYTVMAWFGYALQAILFILKTLFYSTVGFYLFAVEFLYLPSYMALTFSTLVGLSWAFTLWQWVSAKDVRGGA